MKNYLTTALLLLISNMGFSQLMSVVIDSDTKEKIPFVNIWVENENIGTTSNLQGAFEIAIDTPKTIVFSAIGYEIKKISSDSIKAVVELIPKITELDEIIVTAKKQSEYLTIGDFKKSKVDAYFGSGSKPWIVARYFEYDPTYSKTRFLEKIRLCTRSDVKDAKFNIRLYSVNDMGEPDGYIYDKNIIGIARKGKKFTEIDLSELNIKFPEKGFFIAVEWLIIDDNEYNYTTTDSKKQHKGISYEPAFGVLPTETDENSWIFLEGKWRKVWKTSDGPLEKYNDKYKLIAVELTLSN